VDHKFDRPPYLSRSATAGDTYAALEALFSWLVAVRRVVNSAYPDGRELIPAPTMPGVRDGYFIQPVMIVHAHGEFVRRLRESWDHVVREHEAHRDADRYLREVALLLQTAVGIYNDAFTPNEVREARNSEGMRRLKHMFDSVCGPINKASEGSGRGEKGPSA
jgi:hypothetical protein